MSAPLTPYGWMAEFAKPEQILEAARLAHEQGYRKMDAYTPFPIEGLDQALGEHKNWLPLIVLLGGIAGAVGGFTMQYYANVIQYPLIIGGKPYNSLAYLYSHHLRDDDSRSCGRGRIRHARAQ